MLKNKKTTINISYRNITHYIKLGYNPVINSLLEMKTEDLPSSSHIKVDYYDGEYIQEYFELEHNDKRYPTIDHKISVYYGFVNKIEASVIGSESNLCITKRSINSSKREQIEEQFNETKPHHHQFDQ